MNDSQLRALIAMMLREQAVLSGNHNNATHDYYLGQAQFILESSYKNYQPPTGGDQQEVDSALNLLALKGYNLIAPSSDPNFKTGGNVWVTSSDASTPPQP